MTTAQAVWDAVKDGNVAMLRRLRREGIRFDSIGTAVDNHRWNILHHAVASRSLECVKFVMEYFHPATDVRCHEGLTPLARACQRSVRLDIVHYLLQLNRNMVNVGSNEYISPLHFAVSHNRFDVAQALIAHGAKVNARDYADETPLNTVAYDVGNVKMLIYLLYVARARWPVRACSYEHPSELDKFAARASYGARNKIACFKILYNFEHRDHMQRQRYNVDDILSPALISSCSTSLVPYFIECELKFEQEATVRSLYTRLMKNYQHLALLVLCERGPVSSERQRLEEIWLGIGYLAFIDEMLDLVSYPNVDAERPTEQDTDGLVLLRDVAAFFRSSHTAMKVIIHTALSQYLDCMQSINITADHLHGFQQIIPYLVIMHDGSITDLMESMIFDRSEPSETLFHCLRHCTDFFMQRTVSTCLEENTLFKSLVRNYGTWQVVQKLGNLRPGVFLLKRLARDAIREAVWKRLDITSKTSEMMNERLGSLDVSRELALYLTYSDGNYDTFVTDIRKAMA